VSFRSTPEGGGGAGVTTVVAVAVLLLVFGSGVDDVTEAAFVSVATVDGVALIVAVADPPAGSDAHWQETVVEPEHVPPELALAETNVTVAGSVSVTTTLEAAVDDDAGFATVTV